MKNASSTKKSNSGRNPLSATTGGLPGSSGFTGWGLGAAASPISPMSPISRKVGELFRKIDFGNTLISRIGYSPRQRYQDFYILFLSLNCQQNQKIFSTRTPGVGRAGSRDRTSLPDFTEIPLESGIYPYFTGNINLRHHLFNRKTYIMRIMQAQMALKILRSKTTL